MNHAQEKEAKEVIDLRLKLVRKQKEIERLVADLEQAQRDCNANARRNAELIEENTRLRATADLLVRQK